MAGCCHSCDDGKACEGEVSPCGSVPPGVIIPREIEVRPVIEDPQESGESQEDMFPFARLRPGKSIPVNTHLMIEEPSTTASEPLGLGNCHSGSVDVVVFGLTSQTTLEITLEMGFDAENYSPVSCTYFDSTGFARFRFSKIACPLLRFYYRAIGNANSRGLIATTISGSN
ncbi:MAG: hypothetical protein FD180_3481 [Planctomycetota bacterium]|nr:MAG: hypothetical protein FD180_3481 [Planctomycetota bacterium]